MLVARFAARFADPDRNDVDLSVTHTLLGNQGSRKLGDPTGRTAQNECLDAIIVIKMGMHRRQREVVVVVLRIHEPTSQMPLVMIVDVAHGSDAIGCTAFDQTSFAEPVTYQVPKRF